jgi:hypothetical protein
VLLELSVIIVSFKHPFCVIVTLYVPAPKLLAVDELPVDALADQL